MRLRWTSRCSHRTVRLTQCLSPALCRLLRRLDAAVRVNCFICWSFRPTRTWIRTLNTLNNCLRLSTLAEAPWYATRNLCVPFVSITWCQVFFTFAFCETLVFGLNSWNWKFLFILTCRPGTLFRNSCGECVFSLCKFEKPEIFGNFTPRFRISSFRTFGFGKFASCMALVLSACSSNQELWLALQFASYCVIIPNLSLSETLENSVFQQTENRFEQDFQEMISAVFLLFKFCC